MPTTTFFNLPPPKREKLLRAAVAEFARRPYGEVSITRIIQAAEIPRGSFYQYFADKTDLFRYVLQTYGCQVLELASTSLDACGGRLLELPLTMFDRTLERYRADNGAFQNLLGIVRQNVGMDVSQFLNFPRAQQVLLARIDPAGLSFRSREELEVLLKMLVLLTAHALMAVCCGEDSPENTRRLLDRAVEIIRRGAESKEEPVC